MQQICWQLCPKCFGQGVVSTPPYATAGMDVYVTNQTGFLCDVCNGQRIVYTRITMDTALPSYHITIHPSERA